MSRPPYARYARNSLSAGIAFAIASVAFGIGAIFGATSGNAFAWAAHVLAALISVTLSSMAMRASGKWFALDKLRD